MTDDTQATGDQQPADDKKPDAKPASPLTAGGEYGATMAVKPALKSLGLRTTVKDPIVVFKSAFQEQFNYGAQVADLGSSYDVRVRFPFTQDDMGKLGIDGEKYTDVQVLPCTDLWVLPVAALQEAGIPLDSPEQVKAALFGSNPRMAHANISFDYLDSHGLVISNMTPGTNPAEVLKGALGSAVQVANNDTPIETAALLVPHQAMKVAADWLEAKQASRARLTRLKAHEDLLSQAKPTGNNRG